VTVLLIGRSRWSEKISNSIQSGLPKTLTRIVGTREFLQQNPEPTLESSSIIWIATRPQSQIEVLKALETFTGKIIIEKPIGLNLHEFAYLKNSSHLTEGNLRLSRVWNYSAIWYSLKSILDSEITRIEIIRGGPSHNASIPMHIDWMPHDIFLLTDIFRESALNFEMISCSLKDELLESNLCILDKNIYIYLCAGKLPEGRIAQWKIFRGEKLLATADFFKNTITLDNGLVLTPKLEKDAICRMVLDISNVDNFSVELDINTQEKFAKELLRIT